MRFETPNPRNGRRQELARANAHMESDAIAGQVPAFRFDVRRSLRMHPVLASVVAGVVFLLLVTYALSRTPVYNAESLIYVEPLEVRVLNDGSSSGYDPSRYDSYLQQQVQTVERTDTLEAALAKLPPGMWSSPGESTAAAVTRLENALKAERVLNSYQLSIDVKASRADAAAAAANAVTSAYLEEGRKDEHTRADQRLQLLTEERGRIVQDMTEDKAEQARLGTSLGVANPMGASGNPYDVQSEGLRSQLAAAREAHDTVAAQLASVSGANGHGLDTAANELITTDPGLVSIRQTLSQRRAIVIDQMAGLTAANPVYQQDQEEIAALDRSMDRATAEARSRAERQLQDKLRLDLQRTADVEGRLNAQLAEQTSKATGAGPKLQRAAELDTDLQRLSTRYATVDDAIRGLQLETSGNGQAHLVLAARAPDAPEPSRSKLILILALPLALLCGAAAAVIVRMRDHRLYVPGDVQDVLGFPPMCVLPRTSEVSDSAYEDFLLRLAGGLEGAYRQGNARSFLLTPVSVSAGTEGLLPKLCAKLLQIGFRVECVNAEELLSAGDPTAVQRMGRVIGADAGSARDGVAATQLERLLRQYDLLLIQAPPLLGSALTEYAVRCADATILLVESTRTDREDLRRAATLLERLNPQGIGAVLEDMPLRYADSGFRDAVRAADRSPRRAAARQVDKPSGRDVRVHPHVETTEMVERSTTHGMRTVPEEAPESTAALQNERDWTVRREEVQEESSGADVAQDDEAAESSRGSVPHEESLWTEPLRDVEAEERIRFHEAATDASVVRDDPRSWPGEEASVPSVVQEGTLLRGTGATDTSSILAFTEGSAPRALPNWDTWKHADGTADAAESTSTPSPYVQRERETSLGDAAGETVAREHPIRLPSRFRGAETSSAPLVKANGESASTHSIESAKSSATSSTEEKKKPASWWRRLLHLTDEPTLHIVREDSAEVEHVPAESASQLLVTPVREAAGEQESELLTAAVQVPSPAPDVQALEPVGTFNEPADVVGAEADLEAVRGAEPVGSIEFVPDVPSFPQTWEDVVLEREDRVRVAEDAETREPVTEPVAATSPETLSQAAFPTPLAAVSPEAVRIEAVRPAASPQPPRASIEPQVSADSAGHVAADPNGPLGTFPRARTSPITIAAIPSMVTSVARARLRQEQAAAEKPDPLQGSVDAAMNVAPTRIPQPAFRPGLVKAVALPAAEEEGPRARASEGLTAMRTGAGLRKAMVRGEAALRTQTHALENSAQSARAGMSRRWGMLSRFERSEGSAASLDSEAQAPARAAVARVRADAARDSRV